ncbi:radial spoke head protein 9 homolog [Anopheles nili]|uniref:radial spoke head protein 9 homolog n=1 Tax=Anopheles nili TaxID=185578 RepID=UPI00237BA997|nr:radial spoke head protein 9 homolog [Anopheles nili]
MEIDHFAELVPYLSNFLHTIPTASQLKLECSLRLLKQDHRLGALFFLGHLEAHSVTYLLAFGSPDMDLFRHRKFYYSRNGIDWHLLLEPTSWSDDWSQLCSEFTGNERFVYKLRSLASGSPWLEIREQDRLWYVMYAILREAAAVPRGALRMSSDKDIVRNPFFCGLPHDEAAELHHYQHFRVPERAAEENLRGRAECNLSMDVFDRLEVDVLPESKSYSLRKDDSGQVALLSSLHWIGMEIFHKANTPLYGFYYRGDGRKNWDLPFMVDL